MFTSGTTTTATQIVEEDAQILLENLIENPQQALETFMAHWDGKLPRLRVQAALKYLAAHEIVTLRFSTIKVL